MHTRRLIALLVLLGSMVSTTGCAGTADYVEELHAESARLVGHGSTEQNVGAFVWYEYGTTISGAFGGKTPGVYVGPGVSGQFKRDVSGLAPGTEYRFRLCGVDIGKVDKLCSDSRTFRTLYPAIDRASDSQYMVRSSRGCNYILESYSNSFGGESSVVQITPRAGNASGCVVFWCVHESTSMQSPSTDLRTCSFTHDRAVRVTAVGRVREYTTFIFNNPNASMSKWSAKYCLVADWYRSNPRACQGSNPSLGL